MLNQNKQEKVQTLTELINYYELCNRAEGKSPKTINWYTANLMTFRNYLKAKHLPDSIANVDIRLLRNYILCLLKKPKYDNHPYTPQKPEPLSLSSVHGHARTIRAFYSWLQREGMIETNIAKDLKPPRVIKRVIATLTDQEIISILQCFNQRSSSDIRNQTIFMVLLDTGIRIGELINLKVQDLNLADGLMKVLGKGKKERVVPLGTQAQKALQRYMFRYRPSSDRQATGNFFLSVQGRPLTENSLKLVFTRLRAKSGVQRLHAHLCRHTFATRYLINGGDIFTLQQILGHSTLEMVRHYINLASNHVVLQHQKYSPLDRLNIHKK